MRFPVLMLAFILTAASGLADPIFQPKEVGSLAAKPVFKPPDWQAIRALQPKGMMLKLSLPKHHFFLGEEIPATLVFPYERTNYANGYQFYCLSDKNEAIGTLYNQYSLIDPFLYDHQYGNYYEPTPSSVVTSLNQLFCFDQAGTYTIYAVTSNFGAPPPANLVSDRVIITIDPRSKEQEQSIIKEAQAVFSKSDKTDQEVARECNKLWFLGTPAALKELAPFLQEGNNDHGRAAAFGFLAAEDRKAAAVLLLYCVNEGKPLLNQFIVDLYADLKGVGPPLTPLSGFELDQARKEIIDAAWKSASGGTGPAAASAIWAKLQFDPFNPNLMTKLAALQLFLPAEARRDLVSQWASQLAEQTQVINDGSSDVLFYRRTGSDTWDSTRSYRLITRSSRTRYSSELIPAVKKTAEAPEYYPEALELLSKLAPEQARPLVIADIKRDTSLYFQKPNIHYFYPIGDESLPAQPINELTQTFRQKLKRPYHNEDYLLTLVNLYGTPDLLPHVKRFYWQQGTYAGQISNINVLKNQRN